MQFEQALIDHVGDFGVGQMLMLLASSCSWSTLAMVVLSMVFVTKQPSWVCTNAADAQCILAQQNGSNGFCLLAAEQFTWLKPHSSLVSSFGLTCSDSWKIGLCNAQFFVGYWVGSLIFGCLSDRNGRKSCLLLSNIATACATALCAFSPSYWWYVVWRTAQGFCCSGLPIASYVLSTEAVGPSCRGRAGTYSQLVYHIGEWLLPLLAFWQEDWRLLEGAIAVCCLATAVLAWACPESPRWMLLQGRYSEAVETMNWLARMNGRQQLPAGLVICASPATKGQLSAAGDAASAARDEGAHASAVHAATSAGTAVADGPQSAAAVSGAVLLAKSTASFCLDSDDEGLEQQEASDCTALLDVGQPYTLQVTPKHVRGASPETPAAGLSSLQPQQQGQQQNSESAWLLLRHRLLSRYFLVTTLLCMVCAITFYTANLAADGLQGSLYANFIITSLGEVPCSLVAAVAVDWVGRRITIGAGLLVTGIACCLCSAVPAGWAVAVACIGKGACSGTWTVAYVYAAELFPTSIRSAALAGTNQASRLGGVLAPAIIYACQQLGVAATTPFVVCGVIALLTAALLGKLPETLGQAQPDTTADLDHMYGSSSSTTTTTTSNVLDADTDANPFVRQWRSFASIGSKGMLQEEAVPRQGSKLQRLLSKCYSSSSAGSWTIQAAGQQAVRLSGASRASWQALDTEEVQDDQQQQQQQGVSRTAADADMEMGRVA